MTPVADRQPFPTEWSSGLVLVPHPDDPEYGVAAAVAKWTAAGKTVRYALACRGEAGIAGMAPERAGPLREIEQRRSAAIVGVNHVEFWDFPDSEIVDCAELRAAITEAIVRLAPELVLTIYSGPEWGPGEPNQRDHIEFAKAVFENLSDTRKKMPQLYGEDPLEAIRRCVYFNPFWEENVAELAKLVPIDHIFFGSDYPHPEGLAEPLSFADRHPELGDDEVAMVMGGTLSNMMRVDA
jgi:LmbE family N-acetylglucosaminyl deacetylase